MQINSLNSRNVKFLLQNWANFCFLEFWIMQEISRLANWFKKGHALAGIWTQDPERIFILALQAKKLKKNKLQTQKV